MDFLSLPTKYSLLWEASPFVKYGITAFATDFYMWGNNEKHKIVFGLREYVKVNLGHD